MNQECHCCQHCFTSSLTWGYVYLTGANVTAADNARVYYNALNAGDGDDILTIHTTAAGSGNNSLSGGNGNDILHTGAGVDVMYGNEGDDVFVFDNDSGSDNVNDFGRGADKIDLSAVAGVDGYADINVTQLSASSYSVDLGNGDAIRIEVAGGHTLTQSDFLFG